MQRYNVHTARRCAGVSAATGRSSVRHVSSSPSETPSSSSSSSSSSGPLPLRAAMLLHRAPLLTPTPTPFEQSYYAYQSRLRMALSNPPPLDFYFKKGSLTERRFLRAQWERERDVFGERLAGKKVDVGDIPAEEEVKLAQRTAEDEPRRLGQGEGEGGERGEQEGDRTRIERVGAGDLYLVVKDKSTGKWGLPVGGLKDTKEALHEAAVRSLSEGLGNGMDTWLVTRKPIGLIEGKTATEHTFIFKSHILAGSPDLASSSPYSAYAWLTKEEIGQAMAGQGGADEWRQVEPLLS